MCAGLKAKRTEEVLAHMGTAIFGASSPLLAFLLPPDRKGAGTNIGTNASALQ